jgi:ATP-binding cassette subfamily B protein
MVTDGLVPLAWPAARLQEGLGRLARRVGLAPSASAAPVVSSGAAPGEPVPSSGAAPATPAPSSAGSRAAAAAPSSASPRAAAEVLPSAGPRAVAEAAERVGVDVLELEGRSSEVMGLLSAAPPCVLRLPGPAPRFLMLVARAGRDLRVLAPGGEARVPIGAIAAALAAPARRALRATAGPLLDRLPGAARHRRRAQAGLLSVWLRDVRVRGLWAVGLPRHAPLSRQLASAGVFAALAAAVLLVALRSAVFLGGWLCLSAGALGGRFDPGWIAGWILLLAAQIPLGAWSQRCQAEARLGASLVLQRRLLWGALRADPEGRRGEGLGHTLSRVLETPALPELGLAGASQVVEALLALIPGALLLGTMASVRAAILVPIWTAVVLGLGEGQRRALGRWTGRRLEMTAALVESLLGHRTRLVQQPRGRWHDQEDAALERYARASSALDRREARLAALAARGWMVLGFAALALDGAAGPPGLMPIAAGGLLLCARGFGALGAALPRLGGGALALSALAPLLRAGRQAADAGSPDLPPRPAAPPEPGAPLLEVRDLACRHGDRPRPVFTGASFTVRAGDRVLLAGPSGAGKSTLASVLAGQRRPTSGLVLARGLDRPALGEGGWRGVVAVAPAFDENRIFSGTLAYNLLLGRRWPASDHDLWLAEEACRALGLGPLLGRMPAGLHQVVGETGWRLSHGEQARVFLARALLQQADVLILDDTLSALDPGTAQGCLQVLLDRVPTLMVVAQG